MWINKIRLKNYRTFAEEFEVPIGNKNHLLVYGENGSGKSSLFRAVHYFFETVADKRARKFERNSWFEEEEGYVSIEIADASSYHWLHDAGLQQSHTPFLARVNLYSDFLSYKSLIPHYQAVSEDLFIDHGAYLFRELTDYLIAPSMVVDVRTDGADIVFSDLVTQFKQGISGLYEAHLQEMEQEPDVQGQKLREVREEGLSRTTDWSRLVDQVEDLNDVYINQITKVNKLANDYLQDYFGHKVTIGLQPGGYEVAELVDPDGKPVAALLDGNAKFVIFYATKKLADYRDYLNEARLSAFTLCFRLAAIRLLPAGPDDHRLLFLDDVFTGLDMNNRLPLLRLIKEEFMEAEVAPFQVGIATHDRRWYELAKSWFEQRDVKIKAVEMYAGRSEDPKQPDEVVIIQEGLSYIEKARAYFKAKDYPSTANLLRKASEEHMRKLLPRHKRLKIDHNTGLQAPDTSLEDLEKKLIRYLEDSGFDMSRLAPFGTFKKVVLNPLSHDDLEAPHYRMELEDAFRVVEYLLSIEVREVDFPKGKPIGEISMDFSYPDPDNKKRRIKHSIIPREGLRFITIPDQETKLMSCECRYRHDYEAEVVCTTINEAIDQLWTKCEYPLPVNYKQAYSNLRVSNRKTLADILKDADE